MTVMNAMRPRLLAVLVLCPLMAGLLYGPHGGWPGAVGGAVGGFVAWLILGCLPRCRCSA
jgi:hypothetical protein